MIYLIAIVVVLLLADNLRGRRLLREAAARYDVLARLFNHMRDTHEMQLEDLRYDNAQLMEALTYEANLPVQSTGLGMIPNTPPIPSELP